MTFDMLPPKKRQVLNKSLQAEYDGLNTEQNREILSKEQSSTISFFTIASAIVGLFIIIAKYSRYGTLGVIITIIYPGIIVISVCGFAGLIIGVIVDHINSKIYEKEKAKIKAQYDAKKKEALNRIQEHNDNYYNQFKNAESVMAKKLAGSEKAKEIAQGLIRNMTPFISQADRGPNIERIEVTFLFSVYTDRIEFSDTKGTGWKFDFDKWRLHALTDPVEQAAIAHVICNDMCAVLSHDNTEDLPPAVSASTKFEEDYIACTIKYIAPNANYNPKEHW